jgi:hypothetical protein
MFLDFWEKEIFLEKKIIGSTVVFPEKKNNEDSE